MVTEDKAILEVWSIHYRKQFYEDNYHRTNREGHWNEDDYDEVIEEEEINRVGDKKSTRSRLI